MSRPTHCRPQVYELFRSQMKAIETTDGLFTAAVAIAMHELADAGPEKSQREIERYAELVRRRVRSDSIDAKLAHLHDVLFDEAGFVGNSDDYYNPGNSYVPVVLDTHRGLPITLSLVYKAVAERVGVSVVGINAPLHFLAGVRDGERTMLVDPFFGGRALSREEAFERIEEVSGRVIPRVDEMLPKATHRQWIGRILQNLMSIFEHAERWRDRDAMLELRGVLVTEG
ncbi:MAG: transglutaminase-like domain-containing protein [Tepidisphaeraceae bacterium]|jgi:regulator of sirC expression with transglutaminase-like and TPR domain